MHVSAKESPFCRFEGYREESELQLPDSGTPDELKGIRKVVRCTVRVGVGHWDSEYLREDHVALRGVAQQLLMILICLEPLQMC